MASPNPPHFHQSADGLYQILTPDGRAIVNYLPGRIARSILIDLQAMLPGVKFTFQAVPANQLEIV